MRPTRYIHYIYILGTAFLLHGCNEKTSDTDSYVISMNPSQVNGGTRALIDDVDDLTDLGFVVYAYYTLGGNIQQVFTDELVYYSSGAWTYDNTKYWEFNADYKFGAYAPNGISAHHEQIDGYVTSIDLSAPYWQTIDGSEKDLVVATSQGSAYEYFHTNGYVPLIFDHAYAQFVVRVVRSASYQNTYKLTSLAYTNVPTADGTATYTLDYTTPANSAWSDVTLSTQSINVYSNDDGEVITSNPEATPGAKHLVVPFMGSDNIKVTVNYTANGEPQSGTADIGISQLEAGKRYVLTLSLGGGAIITPTLDIEKWIEIQDEKETEVNEDDKHNW